MPFVNQKKNSELEASKGGGEIFLDTPASQRNGKVPLLPFPAWVGTTPSSLPLTPPVQQPDSLGGAAHQTLPPGGGARGIGVASLPQSPGEEAACQAATACQILLLPNCETAAFKETLFWPPATPQTAWYNFIIKEREKGRRLEEREKGIEGRKLLSPSQLVECSAQCGTRTAFQLAS